MVLLFVVCDLWLAGGGRGGNVPTRYILHTFFLYQGYNIPVLGEAHCTTTDNWVSPWLSCHPFSRYSPTGSTWLMYGGGNSPSTRLRATSRNILWSTTKVNEACAWPPHVA